MSYSLVFFVWVQPELFIKRALFESHLHSSAAKVDCTLLGGNFFELCWEFLSDVHSSLSEKL